MDLIVELFSFVEEFFLYLLENVSSIPFSISFGAAVLLTLMFFASMISSALIKLLLIPAWGFALITYFFPTLIPKEFEVASLIIFAAMVGIAALIAKIFSKRLEKTRTDKVISEILDWMKMAQILSTKKHLKDPFIKKRIKEIMKKNKII